MTVRVEANVSFELLAWARNSSGLDIESAAKKVAVKKERLQSWEKGKARPSVKQLRKLARAYKRPLALFYLPEPPLDFQPMRDFRRLPGEVAGVQSPQLRYEVRRAANRREIALELYEPAEGRIPSFPLHASLSETPEDIAQRVRDFLDISLDTQQAWRRGYETFNSWRTVFETVGVMILQMTTVDVTEARGFSISDLPLPVVVVNIKDSLQGRCFTMFHELAHIILHEGGLCDLDDRTSRGPGELREEAFCNMVAGSALVPAAALLDQTEVRNQPKRSEWEDDQISALADRYGVSREVILRRLLVLGRTTDSFYRFKREQYQRQAELGTGRRSKGYAPPYRLALSSAGPLFVRLALSNYYQERITASDLADFLELRLKHLDKIEQAVPATHGAEL